MAILPAVLGVVLAWIPTAEAQTTAPASGLTSARARLVSPNGTLLVPPGAVTEIEVGNLDEADMPALLALAVELTAMPARTEVKLYATIGGAPAKVHVERDKGARLEVQIRGISVASRARLFEIAEMFLAKGGYDVRVEGLVAGRNMEARIRDRVPDAPPGPAALLPHPSTPATLTAGPAVDLYGRWRSTTISGATLVLRPAASGFTWELDAPRNGGLALGRGALRADGAGTSNAEAVALTGQITMGDEMPGRGGYSGLTLVLRRDGNALRGTATGTRNVPVTVEFIKEGTQ